MMQLLIVNTDRFFFKNTTPVIKLVWIIVIVFFIISITVFIYAYMVRCRREKYNLKEKKLKKIYQELFSHFVFSSDDKKLLKTVVNKFKPYTKNKFSKQVLLKTLIEIHKDIVGDIADKLKELYIELGLINDSIKKVKSLRWHIKIKGMRELSDMKISYVTNDIALLTSHPNSIVRKEAQLALVKINGFQGLNFLNTLMYPLSEWQQLLLLETVQRFDGANIPSFQHFLKSKNNTVILFTLKIVRIFNLINLKSDLFQLLDHKNEQIRIETIFVLGELQVNEILPSLKQRYLKCNKAEKLRIIEFFEKVAEEEDIPFLIEQLKIFDYDINIQIMRAVKVLGGKQRLEKLDSKLTQKQHQLLLHVIEER